MIAQFLTTLSVQKRYSSHTTVAYASDLNQFRDFIVSNYGHDPIEANLSEVRFWLATLLDGGLSRASINRKAVVLRQFFKFLLKHGRISVNPMDKISALRQEKRFTLPLSQSEVSTLLDKVVYTDDFQGFRAKLLLEMLYGTGMRIGEMMGVRIRDVDTYRYCIRILGKGGKERQVLLSSKVYRVLESYRDYREEVQSSDYLFVTDRGEKMYYSLCYAIVRRYVSMVTTKHKRSPHVLRHTFANHLLEGGANIRAVSCLMGHQSIASTQHYLCTATQKIKEVYKKNHPRSRVV